ncbi:MAG: hypothetical protein CSB13_11960 [Chloroflexi bacterium]|nr:MAG: hypothetical protein CSB13_11960 [Chloroflexota bacterium]
MSSEIEIANQPAEHEPENDREQNQPEATEPVEPTVLPENEQVQAHPEPMLLTSGEPAASLAADGAELPQEDLGEASRSEEEAEDDGWKAWMEAAPEEDDDTVPAAAQPKPEKKRKPRRDKLSVQDVITYFAPCGRCGSFLSSYRAAYGQDDLETAVYESKSGWLNLTWGIQTQDLILKSFGSRIETSDLYFDGCCSECRRVFIYKGSRSERKPPTFRIEIKPRRRQ